MFLQQAYTYYDITTDKECRDDKSILHSLNMAWMVKDVLRGLEVYGLSHIEDKVDFNMQMLKLRFLTHVICDRDSLLLVLLLLFYPFCGFDYFWTIIFNTKIYKNRIYVQFVILLKLNF